jgi:adenine-specific DNA-methyltransferase
MKMDGKSLDIKQNKLEKLKELFPEVFTEDRVDWEKLKATLGEDINFSNERYVLNWAGKSDAFRALQARTTVTLVPDREESVNFDDTNHIFIEGENLEVLKVLQKSYYGKIKMIYIDPPYNTGNDHFVYPDRFSESRDEYLKRIGDKDEEGYMTREGLFRKNSKDSGHYHSNWLSMMYPRLFLAKNLLKNDGVIFVSIDDNEVHNLRLVMNEIFGEENFVANIVWQRKYGPANDAKTISMTHEHILCYVKKIENWTPFLLPRSEAQLKAFQNPDNDPRGEWRASDLSARTYSKNCDYPIITPSKKKVYPPPSRSWIVNEKRYKELLEDNRIWFGIDGNARPMQKKFLSEVKAGITPQTWWYRDFAGDNKIARYEIKNIFPENIFDTPKPSLLIKRMIEIGCKTDIILDFFSGSSTTAHAVLDLNKEDNGNRKFICVQLPEKCDEKSEAYKAGYKTIADIGKERIRRVIQKIKKEQKENKSLFSEETHKLDLGFKVFKLRSSNFKIWRGDVFENGEDLEKQLDAFTDPVRENSSEENMLYELLLKSGYDLNTRIEKKQAYYVIDKDEMVVALSEMNEKIVKQIIDLKPKKCIALDKLFAGNDQLKTNTVLQMKDAGVEFRTI